jgi:DNA modification methylase
MELNTIYTGDAIEVLSRLPDKSVNCCVTSPPYYKLRDYGTQGQIGHEATPEAYVARLVSVFHEFRRVLKDDGVLWVNLGDCYAGSGHGGGTAERKGLNPHCPLGTQMKSYTSDAVKAKDLIGIPWLFAFAMRDSGWYLRQEIIWNKPNPTPENVRDRCSKNHESIFLFAKKPRYYFDHEALLEPAKYDGRKDLTLKGCPKYQGDNTGTPKQGFVTGMRSRWQIRDGQFVRNKRTVWTVPTKPLREAHFASYPPDLIKPCILAGTPPDGVVLDMFMGSGTTAIVARHLGRNYIGIELNPAYVTLARARIARETASLPLSFC